MIRPSYLAPGLSSRKDGFTVLELLITVFCLVLVIALLLPALGATREASRRRQCGEHLRLVGIAMHAHHGTKGQLPAGWTFDATGQSAYGWAVPLLAYLEPSGLHEQIHASKPITDRSHRQIRTTPLAVMLCPSDITETSFRLFEENDFDETASQVLKATLPNLLVELPTANYVGMFGTLEVGNHAPLSMGDGAFRNDQAVHLREFTRGTTHTLLIGERTMAQVPSTWLGVDLAGEDAIARLVGSALEGINQTMPEEVEYSSRHPGGVNFLWGDGHVSFIHDDVNVDLYRSWSRLN
ncbi:MAG: DUF1559 domain-containing protein [Planctomycetota bacterium]